MDSRDSFLEKVARSPRLTPPPPPLTATKRFELRRRLGAGAFGEVYEARDRESGARIAVKILKAAGPDRLFRFKREFRAVADIVHPNLVRLYELVHEDQHWFLTMELVDGLPFAEHVRRAPEQFRTCYAQLAQAIHALHRAGCLHRDVKLSNVLVERTGRVVLLDFGLALAFEAGTQSVIAGTPHYMAPEQLDGGALTPASDWYAFGVMLYHTLAGVLPFDEPLHDAKRRLPAPPSSMRDGVDPELEGLCMRLLAVDPNERPRATEILEALTAEITEDTTTRDVEPFAGRANELRRLREALAETEDRGALVLVEGEAGIGKTTTVSAFMREASAKGALVFAGRCYEAESVPFKGVDAVVDAISEWLRRQSPVEAASMLPRNAHALATMFPVLKRVEAFAEQRPYRPSRAGPLESRRAALLAFRELVARLSDAAPVVIFVDDVQWATEDGIHLLLELVAPPTPPALFVIAYRKEAVGRTPALDRFLARAGEERELSVQRIDLQPLTRADVDELLAAAPAEGIDAEAAWRESGGHPFLLSRLVRTNARLSHALVEQFGALGAPARKVLEILSLSASSLTQEAACSAGGLPSWDPLVVDELRVAKLVRSFGRSPRAVIEPYHDQVRERLLEMLSADDRRRLHLGLAEFLETSRVADADAIAHHYAAADRTDRAIVWMRKAAEDATESLAFARAAELYGRAAAMSSDPNERVDLVIEHADAMVLAGRRGDAGRACLDACEVARSEGVEHRVAELRARAGEHFMLGGNFLRGTGLLREALAAVGVVLPESAPVAVAQTLNQNVELAARGLSFRARDASELSPQALRLVDLELSAARALAQSDIRAPWIAAKALLDALELGEQQRVQRALVYFSFVNAPRLAEHPLGEEVLLRAKELADALADDVGVAWSVLCEGFYCLYRREIEDALAHMKDAERRFLALASPLVREAGIARIGLVTVCGSYGADLPFAREKRGEWIAEALEREDLTPVTWLRLMGVWVDLAADDVAAARENLRLVREAWASVEDEIFLAVTLMAECAIAVYAEPATSWEETERIGVVFRKLFASMVPVTQLAFARLRSTAALCAFRAGRADKKTTRERVARCVEEISSNSNAREALPLLRGHLAALEGDREQAARLFEESADGLGRRRQRTHQLLALLRCAQARGASTEAVEEELVALGVAAPDRYGLVFAGPAPVR